MIRLRTVCELEPLPAGTHLAAEGEVLVHVSADGVAIAAPNRCQHAGAWLGRPDGCVITCGFHGWRLDASTMRYLAPHDDVEQPKYIVEDRGETWVILDTVPAAPWSERQPRRGLIPGSFRVRFAGRRVVIRAGGPELSWPGAGRELLWKNVGSAGRHMWIPAGDGLALLVEIAGNRLLVADARIDDPPRGIDLLVAIGEHAEDLARSTTPLAVATDQPRVVRPALVGVPVWEIDETLELDVTTGRRYRQP